ncbi:MAG: phosphate uptake regulator PhoU, partial [Candidatus Bathyarchaeia archaeon]
MKSEIRRVQVTGRGSYIVSLPKSWVESVDLKRGEPVFISRSIDGSLTLAPRKASSPPEKRCSQVTLAEGESLESLMRKAIALYLNGSNTISLRSRDGRFTPDQRNYIRDVVRTKLVGVEIVTELPDTVTLQVLLGYPEIAVDRALQRILAITMAMHGDVIAALENLNKGVAGDIAKMDDEVDRFSFYIIRQLKTAVQDQQLIPEIGLAGPKDCLGFRLITKSIERIADHATNIARNIIAMEGPMPPGLYSRIRVMNSFAITLLKDVEKALFSRDYALAERIIERRKGIEAMEEEAIKTLLAERLTPGDLSKLRIILESVRRT